MRLLTVTGEQQPQLCAPICKGMWSITPYARCDFRCVYCITSAQGESEPLPGLDRAAIDAVLGPVPADDLMIFGAFSDAYPSVEREMGVTRRVLESAVQSRRRVTVVTKGDTVLRDIDLLSQLGDQACVQVSICTTDEAALTRIDPGAPSGRRRFEVIEALAATGLRVELNALPWIPDVTDTEALLKRLPAGVRANFSPLAFGEASSLHLLGRTYTREGVWRRYLEEFTRCGQLEGTSWVRPSLPPEENHPLFRMQPGAVDRVGAGL